MKNKNREDKKKISQECRNLSWDNERDCKNEAEYMCICCGEPVCSEHKDTSCPYGGMGYIEL